MTYQAIVRIVFAVGLLVTAEAHASVQVFACEPEWAALANEIGGERVRATTATTARQDPHYIQARPSLIAAARGADLLVCSGSDLEVGWLPMLLRKGNNPRIQPGQPGNLMASQFVSRLDVPVALDRAQGDIHPQGNPHIQTDPRNIGAVAGVLAERLQQIDPDNSAHYQQRLAAFMQQWSAAIVHWQQRAAPLRGKRLVPHHKSWVYLNNWLGMTEVATLESKPGMPPSAAHLNELLALLKASPAALIVRTPYQDPQPSEWLTRQTGIPNAVLPFTVGGLPGTDTLYGLFDVTIDILLDNAGSISGR